MQRQAGEAYASADPNFRSFLRDCGSDLRRRRDLPVGALRAHARFSASVGLRPFENIGSSQSLADRPWPAFSALRTKQVAPWLVSLHRSIRVVRADIVPEPRIGGLPLQVNAIPLAPQFGACVMAGRRHGAGMATAAYDGRQRHHRQIGAPVAFSLFLAEHGWEKAPPNLAASLDRCRD